MSHTLMISIYKPILRFFFCLSKIIPASIDTRDDFRCDSYRWDDDLHVSLLPSVWFVGNRFHHWATLAVHATNLRRLRISN